MIDFVDLGVGLVELVVVSTTHFIVSESDDHVGVTGRSNITRSKIEALQNIELDRGWSLSQQLALDHFFLSCILQELDEPRISNVHSLKFIDELGLCFSCHKVIHGDV